MRSDSTVGGRINILRVNREISQLKLSELIGVTVQTVNKYENEHVTPDAVTLARICEVLDCKDPGWLLTGKNTLAGPGSDAGCPVWYDKEAQKLLCSLCARMKTIFESDEILGKMVEGHIFMAEQIIELRKRVTKMDSQPLQPER
jgi:transcriptional regulator with XRE-family HTH domain